MKEFTKTLSFSGNELLELRENFRKIEQILNDNEEYTLLDADETRVGNLFDFIESAVTEYEDHLNDQMRKFVIEHRDKINEALNSRFVPDSPVLKDWEEISKSLTLFRD